MKTIEEAAREYAKSEYENLFENEDDSLDFEITMKYFTKGVEFAQRWIPVEEELPPIDEEDDWNKKHKYSILVLVKEQGSIYFGKYFHFSGKWSVQGRLGNIQVTHWRPIELKPCQSKPA